MKARAMKGWKYQTGDWDTSHGVAHFPHTFLFDAAILEWARGGAMRGSAIISYLLPQCIANSEANNDPASGCRLGWVCYGRALRCGKQKSRNGFGKKEQADSAQECKVAPLICIMQ